MADFAPPPGPPPPQVPAGWKAVWNAQYNEWFYVNTHTKASQWDKPTEPVYASGEAPPLGPPPGVHHNGPPGYDYKTSRPTSGKDGFGSNNPYGQGSGPGGAESDEAMARRLQAEEEARTHSQSSNRGTADGYYGSSDQQGYGQQSQLPPRDQDSGKKGLFSKISSKLGGSSSRPYQSYGGGGGYPQQNYGQPGYNGGYPQQGYGGYPQPGYGGYPQQGGYYQQPMGKHGGGGGLGAGGGAALGLGAGLLGGALIADGMNDMQDDQGYDDGGGGDDGGDGGD